MYPLKKGKVASQAHVGLPEGTFEEEHGRKGFYGKSAHLYHTHAPTGWVRFEGKLRPHCFDLNRLEPPDLSDPQGLPVAFRSGEHTSAVPISSLPHPRAYRMGAFRRQAAAPLLRPEPAGAARLERSARAAGGVFGESRHQALRVTPRGAHAVLLSQRGWRRADLRAPRRGDHRNGFRPHAVRAWRLHRDAARRHLPYRSGHRG